MPPRPHSHDPQRRATFGTTSPRCTYGEGLASPCRRWPLARVMVSVPTTWQQVFERARARVPVHVHMQPGRWTAVTYSSRSARSRKFIGTVSRHDQASGCSCPFLSFYSFSSILSRVILLHLPSYTLLSFPAPPVTTCPGERRSSANTLTRRAR